MPPYLKTAAKEELLLFVLRHAYYLNKGSFEFNVGKAARLVIGSKGVGKTDTLKRAAIICGMGQADTIVVYHEYKVGDLRTPSALITDALKEHDVAADHMDMDELDIHLFKFNKRVLLILDEMEVVYAAPADEIRKVRLIWSELSHLGNTSSGRYGTILCGSSTALSLLISGDSLPRFPTTAIDGTRAPNLNRSKFVSVHVRQPAFTRDELEHVVHVLSSSNKEKTQLLSTARSNQMHFFLSSNLRRAHRMWEDTDGYLNTVIQGEFDACALETEAKHNALIKSLNRSLWSANRHLFHGIDLNDCNLLDKLGAINWAEDIRPVQWKFSGKAEIDAVMHLVDTGWFAADSTLRNIYPLTPATLLTLSDDQKGCWSLRQLLSGKNRTSAIELAQVYLPLLSQLKTLVES